VWITTAWQLISTELTVKGFKNCCISSAVDESWRLCIVEGKCRNGVRSEWGSWRHWLWRWRQ